MENISNLYIVNAFKQLKHKLKHVLSKKVLKKKEYNIVQFIRFMIYEKCECSHSM
jgi:hypothetical protein